MIRQLSLKKVRFWVLLLSFLICSTCFARPIFTVAEAMLAVIPITETCHRKLSEYRQLYQANMRYWKELDENRHLSSEKLEQKYQLWIVFGMWLIEVIPRETLPEDPNDWRNVVVKIFTGELDYTKFLPRAEPQ